MNNIEVIICVILLLMAVPNLLRKVGWPALAYFFFILFGLKFARTTQKLFSQEGGISCA